MLFRIRVQPTSLQYVNTSLSRVSSVVNPILLVSRSASIPTSTPQLHKRSRLRNSIHSRSYTKDAASTSSSVSPSSPPSTLRIDPSLPHNNLQTFLQYASRSSLSLTSTNYLGTRYEYLTQLHLSTHLQFDLTRTGGRGDSGIDLLGTWPLPSIQRAHHSSTSTRTPNSSPTDTQPSDSIRVIVQCKRLSRVAGPSLMRELEGSFRGAPSGWRGPNVLGIMVCSRGATKGIRDAMARSQRGLVWIYLEEVEDVEDQAAIPEGQDDAIDVHHQIASSTDESRTDTSPPQEDEEDNKNPKASTQTTARIPRTYMRQFLYNAAAASECGLLGLDVGLVYNATSTDTDTGAAIGSGRRASEEPEVQLLWQGKPLDFGRGHGRI